VTGPGLDAKVFVFWNEEGILAGFSLAPDAKASGSAGLGGASPGSELFASVQAQAVIFKGKPGDAHPTPIYMPPGLRSEFLLLLVFAVGGAWTAHVTTRRELTATAHAWAAKDVAARVNRRRN